MTLSYDQGKECKVVSICLSFKFSGLRAFNNVTYVGEQVRHCYFSSVCKYCYWLKIENSVLCEYGLYMLPGLWHENAVWFKCIKACMQTRKIFIICVNFGLNFSILCWIIICSKWTWLK